MPQVLRAHGGDRDISGGDAEGKVAWHCRRREQDTYGAQRTRAGGAGLSRRSARAASRTFVIDGCTACRGRRGSDMLVLRSSCVARLHDEPAHGASLPDCVVMKTCIVFRHPACTWTAALVLRVVSRWRCLLEARLWRIRHYSSGDCCSVRSDLAFSSTAGTTRHRAAALGPRAD